MSADQRITDLRGLNPAAADLALACALAVRVEPPLLRGLRLLLPGAGAAAEADLYFSDLVTARDVTAITLDPSVARVLRAELATPERARLLDEAWQLVQAAHRDAHWSVRLEEQVNYLDAARPPDAQRTIEDLLLAGLAELAQLPNRKGVARWLLGAIARFPAEVAGAAVTRAAHVAAGALLDGRADRVGELLTPEEGEAWLPWLLDALPTTTLHVRLLDGAVVLGATDPAALPLSGVPQTDPLVVEVRWQDGERARSVRVGVAPDEPVRVETGTDLVTLVFLSGLAYQLTPSDRTARVDASWHAAVKAGLRPCLGREEELAGLRLMLTEPRFDRSWIAVWGPRGSGKSVLLVAVADELRRQGIAVIEHFYGSGPPERDDLAMFIRSFNSQLRAEYSDFIPMAIKGPEESGFTGLAFTMMQKGVFEARPLVIVIDGLVADGDGPDRFPPYDLMPGSFDTGVRYLVGVRTASRSLAPPRPDQDVEEVHFRPLTERSDRWVCRAVLARERDTVDGAFTFPPDDDTLVDLVDALPGLLDRLISWLRRQPASTVDIDDIPPSLTTQWESELLTLDFELGYAPRSMLLQLTAADGLNTWADCEQASSLVAGERDWPRFKETCTRHRLVEPSEFHDVVRLADASVGERLRELDPGGSGLRGAHLALSSGAGLGPPLSVERASRTLRAAAIHHALQEAEHVSNASLLCLNLRYLRARYADDPAGLVADIARVTERPSDPATAAVAHVRQAVHALAAAHVPPDAFAAQLYDRIHAVPPPHPGLLDEVVKEPLARPPLAVSRVLREDELRRGSGTIRFDEEPYLACALISSGSLVLSGRRTVRVPDLGLTTPIPGTPMRGAVTGPVDHLVTWSDHEVVAVSLTPPSMPSPVLGPPMVQVDFAAAVPSGAVLASADGTVQHLSSVRPNLSRLLLGHGARITAAAEHGALLTASADGTVRLWDAEHDRARVFTDGRGAVRCLELTLTGTGFVTGGDDGWVRWWDPGASGTAPVARRAGHEGPILALKVLKEGRVVTASADGTLRIWSPSAVEPLVLTGHEDAVTGCAETSAGILSWSADGTVRRWSLLGGPALEVARGFPGGIRSVAVVGEVYAVLCGDHSVERRVLRSGPETPREALGALAVLGDSAIVSVGPGMVTVSRDGNVEPYEALPFVPTVVSVAPDSRQATALDVAGRVQPLGLWNAPGSESASAVGAGTALPGMEQLASLPGDVLALSSGQNVWLAGASVITTEVPAPVTSLAPVGIDLAAGTATGNVHLLDRGTGIAFRVLTSGPEPVEAVTAVGRDQVATGGPDGTVRLLPLAAAGSTEQLLGHAGAVTALVGVGERLVSGGADGRLLLWQPGIAKPLHTVELYGAVTALAAGDGWLAARDATGSLWLLELQEPGTLEATSVAALLPSSPDDRAPDGLVIAEFRFLADTDVELSAATARAGNIDLPIDLWFAPTVDGTPQPAVRDINGVLRLPLWLRAGESITLWAVSASAPPGPAVLDCLISSPRLSGGRGSLTYPLLTSRPDLTDPDLSVREGRNGVAEA
ncbi:hypothetical protein ACPC54_32725 [Kitasatospora sp. NPDC094028]